MSDKSTLKDTSKWARELSREQARTIADFQLHGESLEKYLYISLVEAILQLQPAAPKRHKLSAAILNLIKRFQ